VASLSLGVPMDSKPFESVLPLLCVAAVHHWNGWLTTQSSLLLPACHLVCRLTHNLLQCLLQLMLSSECAAVAVCCCCAALEWVADNAVKPAVASLSLGVPSGQWSRSLEAAVKHVIDAGIPVVVAAGNSAVDACDVAPARGEALRWMLAVSMLMP
jgi:hypothetical protein